MGLVDSLREVDVRFRRPYLGLYNTITSRIPFGRNIFGSDWDVCLILDACRVDALQEVAPEYDFLNDIDTVTSVGSMTAEWVTQTFRPEYTDVIGQTAYLTTNPWPDRILNQRLHRDEFDHEALSIGFPEWDPMTGEDIGKLEIVQDRDERLHEESPHVPHLLTDRAIDIWRNDNFERLVVHYLLPHSPLIAKAVTEDRALKPHESDFATALQDGVDFESVWNAYLQNLRLGLDHVDTLLSNIDAERVLITADHGEAFGEWGVYKHPFGWPQPSVRRVPWVTTTASDSGEYEPEFEPFTKAANTDNLEALGYV